MVQTNKFDEAKKLLSQYFDGFHKLTYDEQHEKACIIFYMLGYCRENDHFLTGLIERLQEEMTKVKV